MLDSKVAKKKVFTLILETHVDGTEHMIRRNDGFDSMELLGYLHYTELEVRDQIAGRLKPDVVQRQFVEQDEK